MKSFLIGLVVLILLVFGGFYLVDTDSPDSINNGTPTSTSPTGEEPSEDNNGETITIPADFRPHAEPDQQYRIALPYSVDISSPQAGITRYRYVGPNNEPNTQITDGYTITIEAQPTSKTSLEDVVTERIEANANPQRATVAGREALVYVTESALQNKPITNYALLPDNGYAYYISTNLSPANDKEYENTVTTIINTLEFLDQATAESLQARIIPIAMLDYGAVGDQYIRESSGKERGCDNVVLIEHILPAPTAAPLTASLQQLFAYERDTVGGWQNFIASQNQTLSFDRATISNGTAEIYLTGALGPLGGVCDNPRAAIQIEETALAYDSVNSVEIYLNDELTNLTPSGRGD